MHCHGINILRAENGTAGKSDRSACCEACRGLGPDSRMPNKGGCVMRRGATPKDHRILPKRIILVRHAESEGNVDNYMFTYVPDPQVPLVRCSWCSRSACSASAQ